MAHQALRRHPLHVASSLAVFVVACGTSGSATGGTGGDSGAFISSMPGSAFEAETAVAVSPSGSLVAAWLSLTDSCFPSLGYASSRDGGETWSAPRLNAAPGGKRSEDPAVAVDGRGNFFVTWLGTAGGTDMHVYLAPLDGTTGALGAPVNVSGGTTTSLVDFPRIAIDGSDGVIVTWLDRSNDALVAARSDDHGATFRASTITSSPGLGNRAGMVHPCVEGNAPRSPVLAAWLEWSGTGAGSSIWVSSSPDGGVSWSIPSATPALTGAVRQPPGCVVRGSDVWVVAVTGTDAGGPPLSPGSAVAVVHSADGGTTWDAPVTVATSSSGDLFLLPQLALGRSGTLVSAFYRGQANGLALLVRAESTDSGGTWESSEWSTAGTFLPVYSPCSGTLEKRWLGDSIGLAASPPAELSVFADNADGASHIRFAKR